MNYMNRIAALFLFLFFLTGFLFAALKIKNYTYKNEITSITVINDTVWIGSTGGLLLRDLKGKFLKSYTTTDGLGYNKVTAVALDSNGTKWFATSGNG